MFVELARGFNSLGFPTFRFDLTGCGDSTGWATEDRHSEIRDIFAASEFFIEKAQLEKVILLGISRGAWLCFSTLARRQLPAAGAILLSTPVSNGKAAVKAFSARAKEYLCMLRDPRHLHRLLSGRVDWRQVGQTLICALKSKHRYDSPDDIVVKSRCPVLLIYGQNDPILQESKPYYAARFGANLMPCHCHIIPDANHSFFHYKWKERIFDITCDWLSSTIGGN
jgi:pimeloyl-ACP methyl ester carboxylesterase